MVTKSMERMNTWGGFYELGSQSSSRSSLSIEEAQPESILPGFGNRCSLTAEGAAELLVSLHHLDAQRCLQNPQPVPNKKGKERKVGSYFPAAVHKEEECSADSAIAFHGTRCAATVGAWKPASGGGTGQQVCTVTSLLIDASQRHRADISTIV